MDPGETDAAVSLREMREGLIHTTQRKSAAANCLQLTEGLRTRTVGRNASSCDVHQLGSVNPTAVAGRDCGPLAIAAGGRPPRIVNVSQR